MKVRTLVGVLLIAGLASCNGEGVTQRTGGEVRADASFVEAPLAELTVDQQRAAELVIGESGFVDGPFTVAAWEPGYDFDGDIVSVVAIVVTEQAMSGTVVWPAYRVADDPDGESVLVGFDVTYELTALRTVSFVVDLAASVLWEVSPGHRTRGVPAEARLIEVGPERRLDGKDEPIPPSVTGV